MKLYKISTTTGQILIAAAILTANPVIADKPSWAGGDKHDKHQQNERHHDRDERHDNDDNRFDHDRDSHGFNGDRYFIDRQRAIIHNYYIGEYQATGHCPPGLAKKNNGCMPPGQAKKWVIGRPLPRDVIFYDLPPAVLVNLGAPPPGYRFVRVGSDILLITIGTGMVIDAINSLGGY